MFQVFLAPFSKPVVIVADIQEVIDMATRRTKEFDRGGFLTGWVGILFLEGTISMPSEAQCAMDEVFKRSAHFGAKGRNSSSHREMIDETFAYIVGAQS